MEILSTRINNSNSVKGFKIRNTQNEIKSIQHADDSTFPVKDIESLEHGVKIIENFGSVSETKLNLSKTECIPLGALKHTMEGETTLKGITINFEIIKCLGIYIWGIIKPKIRKETGYVNLRNLKKILDSWRSRKLTIFGKCKVINSLLISKVLYTGYYFRKP